MRSCPKGGEQGRQKNEIVKSSPKGNGDCSESEVKEFSESQDSRVEAGLVGHKASQVAPESQVVKNLPTNAGDARGTGSIPGSEDPLEEGMAEDSQESSPTPQFKNINSLVLSLFHSPTLTSIHEYWKNHSFDII